MRPGRLPGLLIVLASVAWPAVLRAQEPSTPTPGAASSAPQTDENFADFSGRGTAYTPGSDEGLAQRYRDLRGGGTLEFLRWSKNTDTLWWSLQADHTAYRDQRYSAAFDNFGKVRGWFQFNEIPLYFSQQTQTFFTTPPSNPFALRIDDAIQSGLQNRTLTTTQAAAFAQPFDLRLRRRVAEFKTTYSPTRNLDLEAWFWTTARSGSQPWAGTFGFADAVELPGPVETRTTDLRLGVEWANERGSARLGYDGSFFRNDIETIVWDNPLRITDSPTLGPVQGRMTLWPDSNLNAGTASGAVNLPGRSRATAYISIGNWSQDNPLIPFTVNSALPVIPLDRATSNAKARVTSMNYTFSSRPVDTLLLAARYRTYDYDNRTPVFHVINTVS